MMTEIWKYILGYEDYQISNLGRVKSITRSIDRNYRGNLNITGKIKRFGGNNYNLVSLTKDKKSKTFKVSRLVAIHFIPNPENKLQVNHIDGDTKNDCVSNLEWNTCSENIRHSFDRLRKKEGVFGVNFDKRINKWTSKKELDKTTYFLGFFDTELMAIKALLYGKGNT